MFDEARPASRAHQPADLHNIQAQIDDQVAGNGMAQIVERQPGVIDAQASGVGGGLQRASLDVALARGSRATLTCRRDGP
jgi:hypothetical protein